MKSRSERPSILVLTEDGSRYAFVTLEALIKQFFRFLAPECQPNRFRFEPIHDEARKLLTANQFANRRRHGERVRLIRTIVDQLISEAGFVFQHIDADRVWGERRRHPSVNVANLEKHVVEHVKDGLGDQLRGSTPRMTETELTEQVAERMKRFFRLVPYRELEAWLYQNTARAAVICQENPSCRGKHIDKLAEWRRDRGLLDETPNPPDELCFGKHHNADLIQGYPTAEVVAAGKSLAAAVDAMLGCDALLHAIQRTYETSPGVLEST